PTLGTRSGRRPSASRRTSTRIQKKKDASAVPEAVTGGQGVTPNGSVGFWVVGPFASVGNRTVGVPCYGDIVTTARTGTTTM
ncbi:MAG: hypothetical protein M3Q30_24875, partial [Actinomycetota bacterium]|nr:hypothetical protein [Actinomycetota bacterium]